MVGYVVLIGRKVIKKQITKANGFNNSLMSICFIVSFNFILTQSTSLFK